MQIFDRVDPLALESRERDLWLLALSILFIFAAGIALLVYPAVFSSPVALTVTSPRETLLGFCAMAVLVMSNLGERQFLISRLRMKHTEK